MGRKLVLCSDGTGNSGGKARGTNVWRFYKALDNSAENEQLSFYQDGVGARTFKLWRILGGAFGYGLNANIREMYTFLVENYRPGDDIYLLGFSRGAFTVRALVYLITVFGIEPRSGDPAEMEKRIDAVLKKYHRWKADIRDELSPDRFKKVIKTTKSRVDLETLVQFYRDQEQVPVDELFRQFSDSLDAKKTSVASRSRREGENEKPLIKFVGVWDTVDAVGLPIDELTEALDWLFNFRFYNYDTLPIAEYNYHALSLDDERHTFHPVMWDQEIPILGQHIEQVWFPGVHSNVGGGYPKDEMAFVALDWMMHKAEMVDTKAGAKKKNGLRFLEDHRQTARTQANAYGKIYDSRAGFATYYRYKPRDVAEICAKANAEVKLHEAVFRRIRHATEGYAPLLIPARYKIDPEAAPTHDNEPGERVKIHSIGKQTIWWRRVNYFLLLVTTLFLFFVVHRHAAMPLPLSDGLPGGLEKLMQSFADVLPEMVGQWFVAFNGRAGQLLAFILVFVVLFVFRGFLKRRTVYLGRLGWNLSAGTGGKIPWPNLFESVSRFIRTLYLPARVRGLFRQRLFPSLVFAFVVVLVLLQLVTVVWLPGKQAMCSTPVPDFSSLEPGKSKTLEGFATCNPWFATGVKVKKGEKYQIKITVKDDWYDKHLPATPDGLKAKPVGLQKIAAGFRRDTRSYRGDKPEGWFRMIADIGDRQQMDIGLGDTFTAQTDGPLYLYVNDMVCDLCLVKGVFAYYRNNKGTADILINRLNTPPPKTEPANEGPDARFRPSLEI